MTDAFFAWARDRALLAIGGPDARPFLQGLISNDIDKAGPARAIYAALLTAQGKYLHDFFVVEWNGRLLLDCEAARRGDLARRLGIYKLRSKVEIAPEDGWNVATIWGAGAAAALGRAAERGVAAPFAGGLVACDPRLAEAGWRAYLPLAAASELAARGIAEGDSGDYDRRRLALGLPDGSRDLEVERSILLENGFEELDGVDFKKGCYIGQELTARTHYRALIKKRLVPVEVSGPAPPPGTPVLAAGVEIGTIRSSRDGWALALLKLDALDVPASAGAAEIRPRLPAWFRR